MFPVDATKKDVIFDVSDPIRPDPVLTVTTKPGHVEMTKTKLATE